MASSIERCEKMEKTLLNLRKWVHYTHMHACVHTHRRSKHDKLQVLVCVESCCVVQLDVDTLCNWACMSVYQCLAQVSSSRCACVSVLALPPPPHVRVASIQHHRSPSIPMVLTDTVSDNACDIE